MPLAAERHVSSIELRVDGAPLDPALRARLTEVQVCDHLLLPDTATVRLTDPGGEDADRHPFDVGTSLEVLAGGLEDGTTTSVLFRGEVVALEPEFTERGCTIAVRAYDRSHALHRSRRTRTFSDQTSADVVRRIGTENGLRAGTIDPTGDPHPHLQQSGETDWDLCWRLAAQHDFEFVVDGETFHFRRAGSAAGEPVALAYPATLLAFRPRLSGMQQVREVEVRGHDAATGRPFVHRASTPSPTGAQVGVRREAVVDGIDGGALLVADQVVESADQVRALAQSTLDRVASAWLEAEGTTLGDPALRAGRRVRITGVGRRFSGEYHLSSTQHTFRGTRGYRTTFAITGRSARGLLDLMRPPARRDWGAALVIGLVTNTNDPEAMGRVKVRYPALGDDAEGPWARVAVPNAGPDRGLFMLPQVDDEVVVAFEHGDTRRPYVLGSLFNGVHRPPGTFLEGGRGTFAVASPEQARLTAAQALTISSDERVVVEAGGGAGEVTVRGSGSVTVEARGALTLKGASVDVEASGPVNVRGAIINLG